MKQYLRHVSIHDSGAFGVLLDEEHIPICLTLERTFNERGQTTILPDGTYRCTKDFYNKGGYPTFEIQVAGHDRGPFHKANVETELLGCIGLGFQFGTLRGFPAILQSGLAFNHWWTLVSALKEFELEIST